LDPPLRFRENRAMMRPMNLNLPRLSLAAMGGGRLVAAG